jgi:hypothetical protein
MMIAQIAASTRDAQAIRRDIQTITGIASLRAIYAAFAPCSRLFYVKECMGIPAIAFLNKAGS